MLRDVNRKPRRWRDVSGRIAVVEGWHPSDPGRVGYNVLLEGSWLGTFESLDAATIAAESQLGEGATRLRLHPERPAQAGRATGPFLHLVEPVLGD